VTSSLAVFEAAIWVKSTHLIKSYLKTRKRRKYGNKIFLHKSPSIRSFRHRIHKLLRRAGARGSAEIIYRTVSDVYRQFAGQAKLLRSESRSRIEYIILTNNIKLHDSYFNLTFVIDKLQYVLIRFLIIW